MTTVAFCAVSPGGRTPPGKPIWMRPTAVAGFRQLTDAVHAEGAAASVQIGHAGALANAREKQCTRHVADSPFQSNRNELSQEATRDDIRDVTAAHADAALLAVESGFDAIEVHLGHNYFASSFLSPLVNRRRDEFGGSLENRAKVARGVVMAVRRALDRAGATHMAVTAKLNMTDGVRGGIAVDEALTTAKWLQEDGGLDALELTAGSSLLNPMYLFHGEAPVREFASVFSPPLSWGVRMIGHKFFCTTTPIVTPSY